MKKTVLIILIFIILTGTLLAIKSKSIFGFSSQNPQMSRDRSWKITEIVEELWSDTAWVNSHKRIFYYNSSYSQPDSVHLYFWRNNNWSLFFTVYLSYNDDHEFITSAETKALYNGTTYLPYYRKDILYDSQNRLILYRFIRYDLNLGVWNEETRNSFLYNNNNTYQFYSWNAGVDDTQSEYYKTTYTTNTVGRIESGITQASHDSVNWTNSGKFVRTYHPLDNTTGAQIINNYAQQYILSVLEFRDVFTGNVLEEQSYNWDESNWILSNKTLYSYDNNNQLTEILYQGLTLGVWTDDAKKIYEYDNFGNVYQWVYQSGDNDVPLYNYARYTYSWSQITANDDNVIPAVSAMALKAYPNPFSSNVEMQIVSKGIEPVSIDIYNLKGQIVKSFDANPDQKFEWDGRNSQNQVVSPGVYFFKAKQGMDVITTKVLKIK